MNSAIWWFGAISAAVYSILGATLLVGLLLDLTIRRVGWTPLFLHWLRDYYKAKRPAGGEHVE